MRAAEQTDGHVAMQIYTLKEIVVHTPMVRSEGMGLKRDCKLCGKIYYKLHTIFYVYGSVHHNIFYEITNRCSYMQSILFHC